LSAVSSTSTRRLGAAEPDPGRVGDFAGGNQDIEPGPVADRRDLLLVLGAIGEHRQVEHRAHAIGEVHGREAVVDDVGDLAAIALIEMVDVHGAGTVDAHRLCADDQAHQIEEVAAFLDHRAAGVAGKPVPVPDLCEEGETVLPDRQHLQSADAPAVNFIDERGRRRHVAVFHRRPERRGRSSGPVDDPARVLQGRRKRFLAKDRQTCIEQGLEHAAMGVVGTGDDHRIDKAAPRERGAIGEGRRLVGAVAERLARPSQRPLDRVGKGGDDRARSHREVVDVLNTHHAGADQAVADHIAQNISPEKRLPALSYSKHSRCQMLRADHTGAPASLIDNGRD
jgi:hypothetical protein